MTSTDSLQYNHAVSLISETASNLRLVVYFRLGNVGTSQSTQTRPILNFVLREAVKENVQVVGRYVVANNDVRIDLVHSG